jgi:hypothetical protein
MAAFILNVSPASFDINTSEISLTGVLSTEQYNKACGYYKASLVPFHHLEEA